jgi:predicted GH43/DUF377 family glycosyl hydrolase
MVPCYPAGSAEISFCCIGRCRFGGPPGVWLSRSTDLRCWAAPEPVFGPRPGGWWDSAGVGVGPPPIETPEGWLAIYHGVRDTKAGALYRVGLLLLDLDNPAWCALGLRNG